MKKRFLSMALALIMLLTLLPVSALGDAVVAEGGCGMDARWVLSADGVLTISGTSSISAYNTMGVPLREGFRSHADAIKTIVIEEGITGIGYRTFEYLDNLTSVSIPESVTYINERAFYGCEQLADITVGSSIESIEKNAFVGTAFYDSEKNWKDGSLYLGPCLLMMKDSGAGIIKLPEGTRTIAEYAFKDAVSVTEIDIPASVIGITPGAFDNVSADKGALKLERIVISPENPKYISEDGVVFTADKTRLLKYPAAKAGAYVVPDSVKEIEAYAFYGCTGLTAISLPDGLEALNEKAFFYCTQLESVRIPDNILEIPSYCFASCFSLSDVSLPEGLEQMQIAAFRYCTSLKSIALPDGIRTINNEAFSNCTALESIVIPGGGAGVGSFAFEGCTSLKSCTLEQGVRDIDSYAFQGCTALEAVVIPDSVTYIGRNCFEGCTSLKTIAIPDGVTDISAQCFYGCTALESVSVGPGIQKIEGQAFRGCTALKTMKLGDSVETIGYCAFEDCAALEELYIGSNVTTLGGDVFYGCAALKLSLSPDNKAYSMIDGVLYNKDVTEMVYYPMSRVGDYVMPNTVTSMCSMQNLTNLTGITLSAAYTDYFSGECTFYGCVNLKSINVDKDNPVYSSLDGVLYNKDMTEVEGVPQSKSGQYVVPASVTYIPLDSMKECTELESIAVQEGSETYTSLDGVLYSKDMSALVKYPPAKQGTEYTVNESTKEIRDCAFSQVKHLEKLTMYANVTEMGDSSFEGCKSITDIYYGGNGAAWEKMAYYGAGLPADVRLHCNHYIHDHNYTDVVTAPTCTEMGYTTHTCACGDKLVDSYVDALGHEYENGKCIRCGILQPGTTDPSKTPFLDVTSDKYFSAPVLWAVNHEPQITGGYTDGTFRPQNTCTRAQIVTFIWRAKGCPEPASTDCTFNDVAPDAYYYKAVLWAVENRITGGYNDHTFGSNDTVTRAQAMTFLWRAAGEPAAPAGTVNTFGDVAPSSYYYDAVLWAVANGVTGGYDAQTFGSSDGCTRGQIVTFLYRSMA